MSSTTKNNEYQLDVDRYQDYQRAIAQHEEAKSAKSRRNYGICFLLILIVAGIVVGVVVSGNGNNGNDAAANGGGDDNGNGNGNGGGNGGLAANARSVAAMTNLCDDLRNESPRSFGACLDATRYIFCDGDVIFNANCAQACRCNIQVPVDLRNNQQNLCNGVCSEIDNLEAFIDAIRGDDDRNDNVLRH